MSSTSWREPLAHWLRTQPGPICTDDAIRAIKLIPDDTAITRSNRATLNRWLRNLGWEQSNDFIPGRRRMKAWRRISSVDTPLDAATESTQAQTVLSLREALDGAAADLSAALEQWEASLVARQDPPSSPVAVECAFQAGRQQGHQERDVEILAMIDDQLRLLKRGTMGHLQLQHFKNKILNVDD